MELAPEVREYLEQLLFWDEHRPDAGRVELIAEAITQRLPPDEVADLAVALVDWLMDR